MNPWDFDYDLDLVAVTRLAQDCGLQGDVTALGVGWDYATYLCDGTVIRIPKRADTAQALRKECELLIGLPSDLGLATPRPRAHLVATPNIPYAAMLYPILAGIPLDETTLACDPTLLGETMGAFLARLHATPAPLTLAPFSFEHWNGFARQRLATVEPFLKAMTVANLEAFLARSTLAPVARTALSHQDLNAEHILVNDRGMPVSVIDWGDAGYGPWWFDFTGLWLLGGDMALNAALNATGAQLSPADRTNLQHHAVLAALSEMQYAIQTEPGTAWSALTTSRFEQALSAASE